ncbi:MAG: hypothetical protein B7Y55_10910 [Polynucleobacter sp. 35-46-207]|nr:MAG: hypothetical protein B7Y55_10910 [Polynucleobacter sp. 35-46-207]
MKRIVDIYRKEQRDQVLWTYIVSLGGDGSHPGLEDFKKEALRFAVMDKLVLKTLKKKLYDLPLWINVAHLQT